MKLVIAHTTIPIKRHSVLCVPTTRALQVSDSTPEDKQHALLLCDEVQQGRHAGLLAALTIDDPQWILCGKHARDVRAAAAPASDAVARLHRAVSVDFD